MVQEGLGLNGRGLGLRVFGVLGTYVPTFKRALQYPRKGRVSRAED